MPRITQLHSTSPLPLTTVQKQIEDADPAQLIAMLDCVLKWEDFPNDTWEYFSGNAQRHREAIVKNAAFTPPARKWLFRQAEIIAGRGGFS